MGQEHARCGRCEQWTAMHHNGNEPGTNEFGSPMVFDDHDCDDWRGGVNYRRECTGSGENLATTRHSM